MTDRVPPRRSHAVRKAASKRRLKVCLLSPHPLVLAELERLLSPSLYHVMSKRLESSLASDLRRMALPRAFLYLVDAYPSRPSFALLADIRDSFPSARVVAVAEKFNEVNAFPLLRLGSKGLLTYAEARKDLPRALQAVAAGGFWVPRSLFSRFVDSILAKVRDRRSMSDPADLTRREREVFNALLGNMSNKDIARKLHISERTAKFHVSNLLTKFSVRRRADLILLYFQDWPQSAPLGSSSEGET